MNDISSTSQYNNDDTMPKTLWSATLIDILIDALNQEKPDDQIIVAIQALHKRQLKTNYILNKVRRELDKNAMDRLLTLTRDHSIGKAV